MTLTGQSVAHYRIAEKLGAGGMGEVYRATDTRLSRDVALKVLPEAFAADAQRMARFGREAQLLAALNHPNIATIHGLEESGVRRVLVMELVEGPTLAERIGAGPLPVGEAIGIARQIAEALEYAHEHGIIHRDLKPGNIKMTTDGHVKVLDFGLAKMMTDESAAPLDLATSPTLSLAATKAGIILGTAAYMSPEQAKGKPVDRRADIWSFGVVLWEMLCGQQLFSGETASETMAAVMMKEIQLSLLPAGTPPRIRELLRRCLTKDPKQRLRDIGEGRILIEEYLANPSAAEVVPSSSLAATQKSGTRLWWIVAVAAVVFALALGVVLLRAWLTEESVLQLALPPPEGIAFSLLSTGPGPPAISPDGRMVVYAGVEKQKVQLYLRRLDAVQAQPLNGTDGAAYPFWSPDSRWIGFFGGGKLKKIEVTGAPPVTLCDASNGKGGAWNRDGVILFAPAHDTPLHRVSAAGGASTAITKLNKERKDNSHRHPRFLPDGRRFLYLARADDSDHPIVVGALDGGDEKVLMKASAFAEYASGHLLFLREKTLMAQPFDPGSLAFRGDPMPLAENLMWLTAGAAAGVFSVSAEGKLVYESGTDAAAFSLDWYDRKGVKTGSLGDKADYREVAISPDGKKVAVSIADLSGGWEIWVYEIERNLRTRVTFEPGQDQDPVWSPDSSRLVYRATRKGNSDLYSKTLTGVGGEELLLESTKIQSPMDWTPDGKFLAFLQVESTAGPDIWLLPTGGDRKPFPLINTRFVEAGGKFSPDGKWLLYTSDESGQFENYVVPFPNPTRKIQVSKGGGGIAFWRRDGKEIVYQGPEGKLMAVSIGVSGGNLVAGEPKPLFDGPLGGAQYLWGMTPDAQKFLTISSGAQQPTRPLQLVVNWPAKLKKK